jgi:hypothetical protein
MKLALVDLAPCIIEPVDACRDADDRRALGHCKQIVMPGQAFDESYSGLHEKAVELREQLRGKAHQIVRDNWSSITNVALHLSRVGLIDEAEFEKVLRA